MKMTEYAERDIMQLDENGDHYSRHVSAMTGEELHSKSAIAAELAYRDDRIQKMEIALKEALGFSEWVEILGRTECEIYKHELKGCADRSINRINKALDV